MLSISFAWNCNLNRLRRRKQKKITATHTTSFFNAMVVLHLFSSNGFLRPLSFYHIAMMKKSKSYFDQDWSFWSQYNFYVIPVDIMNTLQREFLRRFMYFVDPKVVIRCGVNKTMKNNKAATTKMKGFPMCLRFILFHFGCSVCNCLPLYKTIRKSISKLKLTIKNSSSSSIHFISIQKKKENPLHLKF